MPWDDSAEVDENASVLIDVLQNDQVTTGPLALADFTQAANGIVVRDENGTPDDLTDDRLTYSPNPGFEGPTDSFSYTVRNGNGVEDTAVVTVNVIPNATPVFVGQTEFTVLEETTPVGTVEASDAEGEDLTFEILPGRDGALFDIDATGALRFRQAPDFEAPLGDGSNSYTLDVTVEDEIGQTVTETFTVTVENDPADDFGSDAQIIEGTPGRDRLVGTDGVLDAFVFTPEDTGFFSRDQILDFETGDLLDLRTFEFGNVEEGSRAFRLSPVRCRLSTMGRSPGLGSKRMPVRSHFAFMAMSRMCRLGWSLTNLMCC